MGTFAVLLHEDERESNDMIRERIETRYPKDEHYKFAENLYLVTGPRLANEVVEALGMTENDSLAAVVLRLNGSFTGRSWTSFWDWMRAANEPR
ncbi:MAG: hypothetical protein OXI48_08360 [bacterium]|nr:hypothetical protein [bacterium]